MTQVEKVLHELKQGKKITQHDASAWGITRLGARIYDLKQQGHNIQDKFVDVPTRYGSGTTQVKQYWLVKEGQATLFEPQSKGAYSQ